MLNPEKLREADLVASGILAGLGVAVIVGACQMPMGGTYAGMPITWYTSPGFFPFSVGSMLVLCAVAVFLRAWREGAWRRIGGRLGTILPSLPRSPVVWRMMTIWVLLAGYVVCLAWHPFARIAAWLEPLANSPATVFLAEPEGANYVCSSFVFLGLFIYCFYYRSRRRRGWMGLSLLLVLCLFAAWGVGYVFTQHLYSPLPW